MKKLYVENSIEIAASPARVWQVLTLPAWTQKWAREFGATGPIDSNWAIGSTVLWRNAQGEVYVRGNVIDAIPLQLLRFTVCDVFSPAMRPVSGSAVDEITQSYSLVARQEHTVLHIAHGDFAKLANGEQLYPLVIQLWDRLLPRLKGLAEGSE